MRYRVPKLSWALVLVLHFSEAGSLSPKLVCVLTVPRALGTRGCAELPEAGRARSGVPGAGAAAAGQHQHRHRAAPHAPGTGIGQERQNPLGQCCTKPDLPGLPAARLICQKERQHFCSETSNCLRNICSN